MLIEKNVRRMSHSVQWGYDSNGQLSVFKFKLQIQRIHTFIVYLYMYQLFVIPTISKTSFFINYYVSAANCFFFLIKIVLILFIR